MHEINREDINFPLIGNDDNLLNMYEEKEVKYNDDFSLLSKKLRENYHKLNHNLLSEDQVQNKTVSSLHDAKSLEGSSNSIYDMENKERISFFAIFIKKIVGFFS